MSDETSQFIPVEKSIADIFTQVKFEVPVYQRPYRWEADPIKQLWNDIISFYMEDPIKAADNKVKYFLGPIVTFWENDTNQIIDGQQRITTIKILLFLLFSKLKKYDPAEMLKGVPADEQMEVINRITKITACRERLEKCLWISENQTIDYERPLLNTKVIGYSENKNLREVFFQMKSSDFEDMKKYFRENTMDFSSKVQKDNQIVHFKNRALLNMLIENEMEKGVFKGQLEHQALLTIANVVMDCCRLLKISCDKQDSALKIFNTLNARGQLLASADILKSSIFSSATKSGNEALFITKWEEFVRIANDYKFKTSNEDSAYDVMFRYLMHIYKSKETQDNTDPGLLKYFDQDNKSLMTIEIFNDLLPIAKFWTYVSNLTNKDFSDDDDDWKDVANLLSEESKKFLQILSYLQNNPFWRHMVSNYYWRFWIKGEGKECFKEKFTIFLKYLTAYTIKAMLSSSDIKSVFYKQRYKVLNDRQDLLYESVWWDLNIGKNIQSLMDSICDEFNSNVGFAGQITRSLLLLHAYTDPQQEFILGTFDIEHIFPQDFAKICQTSPELMQEYDLSEDSRDSVLQSLGNKMALEKTINIKASNNPWLIKKEIYLGKTAYKKITSETKYQEAKYLASCNNLISWKRAHIEKREKDFREKIATFLQNPMTDFSAWVRPDYSDLS